MAFVRAATALAALAFTVLLGVSAAGAVEAVNVRLDASAIDLTNVIEKHSSQGDRLQVSTAPGSDGIVRRIEVRRRKRHTHWIVFALTNDRDEQIERLIVARITGWWAPGVIWPDLGASRISAITPVRRSARTPESPNADVFRLTLDPGTMITYVAELRTPNLPQLYLWEPDAYKDKVND